MGLLSANAREHLVSLRESGSIHQTQLGESGVLNADPYFEVVYQSSQGSGAIIAVDESVIPALDILLPPYVAAVMLPNQPAPFVPVSDKATERINSILAKLRFNPDIASVLSTLSVDSMRSNIRRLTGESPDPYGDYILSRHSFSKGARDAANWIQEQIEYSGATCRQEPFLEGYAPNVICRYPGPLGTANESMVLFSGHYDSRGSFGSTRAPGANDDGSGTVSVLAIARAIRENRIRFTKYAVELATFAGEEQGLRGSNSYARKLREQGRDVVVMVQADMLAYHSPGEPAQLGLPDLIGLPEVAQLIANVSKIYSPELTLGITPACCSDHQSFHYQGYPSTQVYERAGPIIDPMYHNTGDLSERRGYDLQQVRSIAKLATLLETAGFAFESD
ncbi:Zn-dependent exopeptidase [Clavulina sp. PMI_390]|nr:Zn-dependent exopeptidase [Clavulina sp. PMI_390]